MRKFRNVTWKLSTYATIIHPIPTTHNHVNANGSTFCFLASLNKSIICKRPTVQTLNNDRIKNRIKYTPAVIRTALLFQTSGSVLSIFNNTLNAWKNNFEQSIPTPIPITIAILPNISCSNIIIRPSCDFVPPINVSRPNSFFLARKNVEFAYKIKSAEKMTTI